MKIAKYFLCLALLLVAISAEAQQLRKEAFDLLNLDYPGLEKVKAACAQQQWDKAAQALLDYYRQRTGIGHPDINLKNIKISKEEQKWADDALEHTFLCTKDISLPIITVKTSTGNIGRYRTMSCAGSCIAINGSPRWEKHIESQGMRNMPKNGHTNIWTGLRRIL